jgi:ABC-2 type transport system ATP-binding protein
VLIKRPRVVFLDEPTIALDPDGVNHILGLIVSLSRERKMTILLSSHLLEQVQRICDRIGIFVRGKLVAQGRINELGLRSANGTNATVELGATPLTPELIAALKRVDGVRKVEQTSGDMLLLQCRRDIRPQLARAVTDAGANLMHLRLQVVGLEEIYFRYFREN